MKINTKPFEDLINNYCQYDTASSRNGREAWTEIIKLAEAVNAMMPEEKELKLIKCPWCLDSVLEMDAHNKECFFIACEDCGCDGPTGDTEKEAMIKWNERK